MLNFIRTIYCSFFILLCGCQSNPTFDTFTNLLPWTKKYSQVSVGLEYILVSTNENDALMALGERRIDESKNQIHEHWYTGQGEMLYLVNGRIQKALGFTNEIRSQINEAPTWNEVVESRRELTWRRKIDLMPGFRYGVINNISTKKIETPSKPPDNLPTTSKWIADLVESKTYDGKTWWFTQRFALFEGRIVYSEQCISSELCLKIKHLGVLVSAK